MSNHQIKLNEIIRLCTDLSMSLNNTSIDNNEVNSQINNVSNNSNNSNNINDINKTKYNIVKEKHTSNDNKIIHIDFIENYSKNV